MKILLQFPDPLELRFARSSLRKLYPGNREVNYENSSAISRRAEKEAMKYAEKYEKEGHEVFIASAPCFGACDLAIEEAKSSWCKENRSFRAFYFCAGKNFPSTWNMLNANLILISKF